MSVSCHDGQPKPSGQWTNIFPPKPKFSINEIPDLTGKIIIVTGGNTGVGKETCKVLLQKNAKVYLGSRSEEKARKAINELKEITGKEAVFFKLDLANLDSIRKSVEEYKTQESELHVLFNSAGVMWPSMDALTDDGYDCQFGTNTLGHYFLTTLLLPTLLSTADHSPPGTVRVIHTSSMGHMHVPNIKWETLKDGPARRKLTNMQLYGQSKLAKVLYSNELAEKYGDRIVSISLHPGNVKTELTRHGPKWQDAFTGVVLYPAAFGALTQLYAGTMPEAANLNGKYLIPWARIGNPSKATYDEKLRKETMDYLEEQVKAH